MITIIAEGIGLGHISRCIPLAKEIAKHDDYCVLTFGSAYDKAVKAGIKAENLKIDFSLKINDGALKIENTTIDYIIKVNYPVISKIMAKMRRDKPDIVISDSSVSGLLAAKLSGHKKIIYMANQTDFSSFPSQGMLKKSADYLGSFVVDSADKIIVPDLPAPYSICLDNIKFFGKEKKFSFTGPIARKYPQGDYSHACATMGGDSDGGVLTALDRAGVPIRTVAKGKFKSLKYAPDFDEMFGDCGTILAHGGHSTLMEAIISRKAVVGVPMNSYSERVLNLKKMQKLGLCEILDTRCMDKRTLEFALSQAWEKAEASGAFYDYAASFDGPREAAASMLGI